jgi:hypothetical protein
MECESNPPARPMKLEADKKDRKADGSLAFRATIFLVVFIM